VEVKEKIKKNFIISRTSLDGSKQEALTSWKSYQETGRHLAGQEVGDWLNTWGTDEEKEIPPCHE